MMKRFATTLALATLVTVSAPMSTAIRAAEISFRVPFAFVVNGVTLPPGDYTITTTQGGVLVRGFQHAVIVLSNGIEATKNVEASAVFVKQGDHYSLSEVWMAGRAGRELVNKSAAGDRIAAAPQSDERVVITAK